MGFSLCIFWPIKMVSFDDLVPGGREESKRVLEGDRV